MATVYSVNIKTVSAFNRYSEEYVNKMFEKFLKEYRDEKTGLKFESNEISTKIEI